MRATFLAAAKLEFLGGGAKTKKNIVNWSDIYTIKFF